MGDYSNLRPTRSTDRPIQIAVRRGTELERGRFTISSSGQRLGQCTL